jgi:OPA family glycerol-3-phosphate transporter-like MFS transporter
MSLPVSLGTFATYGISALFSALSVSFRGVFIFSAIIMFTVATVWFLCLERIKQNCLKESAGDVNQQREETIKTEKEESVGVKAFVMLFCLLAVFAVVNNFVKDGVNTWMPKILEEKYLLNEAISTFLTLFLPLFSVFGAAVASLIYVKAKGYILTCGILYGCSAVLILLVVLFLDLPVWIVTLLCFMLVSMCMSGVNNVLTGLFPMTSPKNFNPGLIAGLIDGFCYVGSAITTYGLGSVSDNLGWDAVIYLLLFICGLMVCVCAVYTIIEKFKKRKI